MVAAGIAGCAGGAPAPTEATRARLSADAVAVAAPGDTVTDVFILNTASGGDFRLGGQHWIHFAQKAVCDPATSSYGPEAWDAPCEPAKGRITVTAVSYTDASGHPRVDFSPELRFVPSSKKTQWVYLTMADRAAAESRFATILYCGPDGGCVDEAAGDATLATQRSKRLGTVSRRVKHFSGYLISAGRTYAY